VLTVAYSSVDERAARQIGDGAGHSAARSEATKAAASAIARRATTGCVCASGASLRSSSVSALGVCLTPFLLAAVSGASTARSQTSPAELSFMLRLRDGHAGAICVAQSRELRRARRITGLGQFTTPAWSPDGRRIAVGGGKRAERPIRIANADASGWRTVTRPRPTEEDSAPWWPDGSKIAFSRYVYFGPRTDYSRAGVWIVDVVTREERQISRTVAGSLAWSPTGGLIGADPGGSLPTDMLLLREDGRVERRIRLPGRRSFEDGLSWSPDGARLALGGGAIIDREGREVRRFAPRSTASTLFVLRRGRPTGRRSPTDAR
jgi:Tol biopolymer transport system component